MKTFKDFVKEKVIPNLETVFGSHSLPQKTKKEVVMQNMHTIFGKHSVEKKNLNEGATAAGDIQEHSYDKQKKIHAENSVESHPDVREYTKDSIDINSALHRHRNKINDKQNNSDLEKAKRISDHLDKHRIAKNTHVFTGLKESPAKHFEKLKKGSLVTVHLPAFTSTSTKFNTARGFTQRQRLSKHEIEHHEPRNKDAPEREERVFGSHVLKIHVPKGTSGGSVIKFSHFGEDEHEILLNRGHNIKIHPKPTVRGDGIYIWHAKIHSHTPEKLEPKE